MSLSIQEQSLVTALLKRLATSSGYTENALLTDIGNQIGAALIRSAHVHYDAPIAAVATNIVANVDITNTAFTIAAQPDFPRKIQIVVTDANSSITAGTVTIVGVGVRGEALTQVFSIANQGTKTYTTAFAYATVTSITAAGLVGQQAATDKINAGVTNDLGLPGIATPPGTAILAGVYAVYKANVTNVNEAVGTVDATAGTIAPTSAPNAVRTYDFWYSYTQL